MLSRRLASNVSVPQLSADGATGMTCSLFCRIYKFQGWKYVGCETITLLYACGWELVQPRHLFFLKLCREKNWVDI